MKKLPKANHKKIWIGLLVSVITLQALLLILVAWRQNVVWEQLNGPSNQDPFISNSASGFPIKMLIQSSLRGLYLLEPVADINKPVVYLPEVKISLPLNLETRDIRYSYEPTSAEAPAQVSINTFTNMNHVMRGFGDVPCLQRVVGFTIDKKDPNLYGGKYTSSTKLADGRTLYIWENDSSSACSKFWPEPLKDSLIGLLKQAKSY